MQSAAPRRFAVKGGVDANNSPRRFGVAPAAAKGSIQYAAAPIPISSHRTTPLLNDEAYEHHADNDYDDGTERAHQARAAAASRAFNSSSSASSATVQTYAVRQRKLSNFSVEASSSYERLDEHASPSANKHDTSFCCSPVSCLLCHTERWKFWTAFLLLLTITLGVVAHFFVIPGVIQAVLAAAPIAMQSIDMRNPAPASIELTARGTITAGGALLQAQTTAFSADVKFNGKRFGAIPLPALSAAGVVELKLDQIKFHIDDASVFQAFLAEFMQRETVQWELVGVVDMAPTVLGIALPTYKGIAFNKFVSLAGLNGLQQITILKTVSANELDDPLMLNMTIELFNPSVASLVLPGSPVLALSVQSTASLSMFGELFLPTDVQLVRGKNVLQAQFHLVPPADTVPAVHGTAKAVRDALAGAHTDAAAGIGADLINVFIAGARIELQTVPYLEFALKSLKTVVALSKKALIPEGVVAAVMKVVQVELQSIDILDCAETSFNININGAFMMVGRGVVSASLETTDLQIYYNDAFLGTATIKAMSITGRTTFNIQQRFSITAPDTLKAFMLAMLSSASVAWRVKASITATPAIFGVPLGKFANLPFDKMLQLPGLNGLQQIDIVQTTPSGTDPLLLNVQVKLTNPSIAAVQMPGVTVLALAMGATGTQFAEMQLPPNYFLMRGDNFVSTSVRLVGDTPPPPTVPPPGAPGAAIDLVVTGARVEQSTAAYITALVQAISVRAAFPAARILPAAVLSSFLAASPIEIQSLDITNPQEASFQLVAVGAVTLPGANIVAAALDALVLAIEFNGQALGTATVPAQIFSGRTQFTIMQSFAITQPDTLKAFMTAMLVGDALQWRVTSAVTLQPLIGGVNVGSFSGLTLDKQVALKGLGNLKGLQLLEVTPASPTDPLAVNVKLNLFNPSIAAIAFGASTPVLALTAILSGAQFVDMQLSNLVLARGDNILTTTARVVVPTPPIAADAQSLGAGMAAIDVRIDGVRVDNSPATYITTLVQSIKVTAAFDKLTLLPPSVIANVVNNAKIEILTVDIANPTNDQFTLSTKGAMTLAGAGVVSAAIDPIPLTILFNGQVLGSAMLPALPTASGRTEFAISAQPFAVTSATLPVLRSFLTNFVKSEFAQWQLQAAVAATPTVGGVAFPQYTNVPLNAPVALRAVNGPQTVQILKLSNLNIFQLSANVQINMVNPSIAQMELKGSNIKFAMIIKNIKLAEMTAPAFTLVRGNNVLDTTLKVKLVANNTDTEAVEQDVEDMIKLHGITLPDITPDLELDANGNVVTAHAAHAHAAAAAAAAAAGQGPMITIRVQGMQVTNPSADYLNAAIKAIDIMVPFPLKMIGMLFKLPF